MFTLENTANWMVGMHNGEVIINKKRKAATLVLTGSRATEFVEQLKVERRKRIIFEVDDKPEDWEKVLSGMFDQWQTQASYLVA